MRRRRDDDRTYRSPFGVRVPTDGSLTGTIGLVVAFHVVLATAFYPVVAATIAAGFGLGVGVARLVDDERDNRQVCVPATDACVEV